MILNVIIAVVGLLEAVLPFVLSKLSKKNSKKRMKKTLLPHYAKPSGNKEIDDEIDQIFNQYMQTFQSSSYTSVYFKSYNVSIELTVEGDSIAVKSSYTISFINPYKIDYVYKRKPMLCLGLQYDTYRWENVTYQGRSCREYIHEFPQHQQQTPNNKYRFKTGLEVPLEKEHVESCLHYSTEYRAEAANFFNSYRFWHYCKMFTIDVSLHGPDADKYEIQWEVFLSTNHKHTDLSRNVHRNDAKHISLSSCGWIFPSDGYVISLSRKG